MLDRNAVADIIRRPQRKIAGRIASIGEYRVCTSIVIAAEFRYGGAESSDKNLASCVDLVLSAL